MGADAEERYHTWQDVARNDGSGPGAKVWVSCAGSVYDITPFVAKHPGGTSTIGLAAGRDITQLLPSYHPFAHGRPELVLAKHRIGSLSGPLEFPSYKPDTSGFYEEMRAEIERYFKDRRIDPKDATPGLVRMAVVIPLIFAAHWLTVYVAGVPMILRVAAAIVFGVCQALQLLHVMHDASHCAITHTPILWNIIGTLTMDVISGASIHSWLHQHVLSHHLHTNVHGADADVPTATADDIRRIHHAQRWGLRYVHQWIYLPVLYSLLGLRFRMQDITNQLVARRNGPLRVGPVGLEHWMQQISVKILFAYWRLYLPLRYSTLGATTVVALFLVCELTTGAYLSWNFQVSHVSDIADFPSMTVEMDDEWAVVQCKTSVDYAHNDPFVTFMSGALNYQIEHHLFPSVSQYHYPAIAPIVEAACKRHGVPYNRLGTFVDAFVLHLRHLWKMGAVELNTSSGGPDKKNS